MKFVWGFAIFCTVFSIIFQSVESRAHQTRIVAGTPASVGQFPWQVVLKKDAIDDLLCGGSIISQTWVLTAAHCTYGLSSIYMIFGTISLANETNNQTSKYIIPHPDYNPDYLYNDVSLIGLSTPLVYSSVVKAIPLVPPGSNNNFLGRVAVVSGYGYSDDENLEFSENLQFAFLKIIDNSECEKVFGSDVIINSTMCAKGIDDRNQSICSGDSGGPLIAKDPNGNWMQIGINSFVAEDQCTVGFPSAFVRLTSFVNYILTTTGLGGTTLADASDDDGTTLTDTTTTQQSF